jgi:hypothetical protein
LDSISAILSSSHETSAYMVDSSPIAPTAKNPIVLGSSSEGSNVSIKNLQMYAVYDPRYTHPPYPVIKCACTTLDSVCNQPRKMRRRSNLAVALITLERLGLSKSISVVDLPFP